MKQKRIKPWNKNKKEKKVEQVVKVSQPVIKKKEEKGRYKIGVIFSNGKVDGFEAMTEDDMEMKVLECVDEGVKSLIVYDREKRSRKLWRSNGALY